MTKKKLILSMCLMVILAGMMNAQPPRGTRRGSRLNSEQFRQRMLDRMKEMLKADDKAWKVIKPRLNKVMQLSVRSRGMMSRRRPPQNDTNAAPKLSAIEQAQKNLEDLLEQEKPSSAQIKEKLKDLRAAREKQKQKLASAQQKLREVLSLKQEARLILRGLLD